MKTVMGGGARIGGGAKLRAPVIKPSVRLRIEPLSLSSRGGYGTILGEYAPLTFKIPKKERTTLTKEMTRQVQRYVTRHVAGQINPLKKVLSMERKLSRLEQKLGQSGRRLRQELEELRQLWAAALSTQKDGDVPTSQPKVMRLLQRSYRNRNPQWLKRQIQRISHHQHNEQLVFVAPSTGERERQPDDRLSRQGLAFFLDMLNAVPNAPPMLRRLSSKLRKGLPVSILPATPTPQGKRRTASASGDDEELKLRRPISGVLRMRIEPPEAAAALAEHMQLAGATPLVYKRTPSTPPEPKPQSSVTAPKASAVSVEMDSEQVEHIARVAKDAIRSDLLQNLPDTQVRRLAHQVYNVIEDRLKRERQRRGYR